jgi:hypothetical protein
MTTSSGPTPAERARTLAQASRSLSVRWRAGQIALVGGHACDRSGRVVLAVETADSLAEAVCQTLDDALPAVLDFTDAAPVPLRDRIRARLTLAGWLSPLSAVEATQWPAVGDAPRGDRTLLRLDPARIELTDGAAIVPVSLDAHARSEPDPLAPVEAECLQHLVTHHPDAVELLCRLVDPRVIQHAVRVLPAALDRYGLVLRAERHRGHVDVRLPFTRRADTAPAAGVELRTLLVQATQRRCRRRGMPLGPR